MVQTFQISALALPIADRIVDEFELTDAPEIGNRENGVENGLQTSIVALVRQKIHLQKALVRLLLYFDQIRDWYRRLDFRKINSFGGCAIRVTVHFLNNS